MISKIAFHLTLEIAKTFQHHCCDLTKSKFSNTVVILPNSNQQHCYGLTKFKFSNTVVILLNSNQLQINLGSSHISVKGAETLEKYVNKTNFWDKAFVESLQISKNLKFCFLHLVFHSKVVPENIFSINIFLSLCCY